MTVDPFGLRRAETTEGRRVLDAYDAESTAAIDLEACNPFELFGQLCGHPGIAAEIIDNGRGHGWPTYRYSGRVSDLLAWLADAYDDGSGETAADLLARHLYPEGITA